MGAPPFTSEIGRRGVTYYAAYLGLLFAVCFGRASAGLRSALYFVLLLGLFLFSGFRFEVGCDWSGYLNNWLVQFSSYRQAWSRSEPAHWTLIHFLHQSGLPYQYLNVVTSGIFFTGLHMLARRQPNRLAFLALAFPILIINMPMSGIRQGAAIGLLCFAFNAFRDRRLMLYVGWVLAGSLFHSSSLLFLVLAPFVWGRLTKKNMVLASLLAAPGLFALMQTEAADVAASRYIDTGVDAAGAAFRLGILSLSGVLFQWKLAPAWRREFPQDYKLASIGAWMMIGFLALVFVSSVIGDRFGYYLIPIQIMIFSRIPYLKGIKNRPLLSVAPYVALSLVFIVWTQMSGHFNQCYIPYDIRIFMPLNYLG